MAVQKQLSSHCMVQGYSYKKNKRPLLDAIKFQGRCRNEESKTTMNRYSIH